MPFEEFMRLALYHAEGFFGGGRLRSEQAGDFLTSPEVSPLFGATLAQYVAAEHRRIGDPFAFCDVGAGSGSLLRSLLDSYPVDAYAVDASPAAREAIASFLPSGRIGKSLDDFSAARRGVVLANELIDNLPMAVAQRVDGTWRERWVDIDGDGFVFVDRAARPEVRAWLDEHASDVQDGGWVEAQIEAGAWLRRAIDHLEAGSIVIIDYGDTSEGLLPRRADGTLRTYRAHHLGPHPLDEPGETDITADVNFTALKKVGVQAGAEVRLLRQDDFLTELGMRDHLSQLRYSELGATRAGDEMERIRIRSLKTEVETLLHPRGLGDFRVLTIRIQGTNAQRLTSNR